METKKGKYVFPQLKEKSSFLFEYIYVKTIKN